jgi:glutathione S-transferase
MTKPMLYDFHLAPNPLRARILLKEKGIDYDTVEVALPKGEQLTPEYRKINFACTTPTLKLADGTFITDNAGIAAWAEAEKPEPPLLGRTPSEKGVVASMAMWALEQGFHACGEAFRNSAEMFADRGVTGPLNHAQIPALAERGQKRAAAFLKTLDEQLAGKRFLAGEAFSYADITAWVSVNFAERIGLPAGPELKNLARWRAEVSARPAFKT